ncbi:RimJ/RimL family protein N-acetyltransferase [Streptacidiphilus sp. BW17]|uniref:GNAT family N-acetyltransferase n=1 Tax=Streptacidiphilus sp. BW17 TaxID=3156274 RepID=UPI00351944F0
MSMVGRKPFVTLIGRCLLGTLVDRSDAFTLIRHTPREWVERFLERHAKPVDEPSWLLAATESGTPVGFVGVAGRPDEPEAGTLVLIGVLLEHRGKRYVDVLIHAGSFAARARGFDRMLSLVDVANQPMMAAMHRTGYTPDAHPWHKWLYVRTPELGGSGAGPRRAATCDAGPQVSQRTDGTPSVAQHILKRSVSP